MADDETIRLAIDVNSAGVPVAAVATKRLKDAVDTYAFAAQAGATMAKHHSDMTHGYAVQAAGASSAAKMFAYGLDAEKRAADQAAAATKALEQANVRAAVSQAMAGEAAKRSSSTITTGMNSSGVATGMFGNKLMVAGQLMDDFQYVGEQGLRPVIGNLMQFSAVLGIGGIAVNLLWNNWDKIAGLWREKHTETEAERMERLEKATTRTAAETRELNKHKQHQAEIEKVLATQSAEQKGAGSEVGAVTDAVGGAQAVKDLTAALIAESRMIGRDSSPDRIKTVTEAMTKQATGLIARAQGGDIGAAAAIRETMDSSPAARASATGRRLLYGDPDAERKVNDKLDKEADDQHAKRMKDIADEEERRLKDRLEYERRQKEFMVRAEAAEAMEAKRKAAELEQQKANELDARLKAQRRTNQAEANAGMMRRGARSGVLSSIDQMMMEAREVSAGNPMRRPRAKTYAEMTPAERRELGNSMTAEEVAGGKTVASKALENYKASLGPMSMEEQEQEMSRRNAANDEIIKGRAAKELLRKGVARTPEEAEAAANMMVNQERKAMDAATGDQPLDENTKATERLTQAIEEINRKGVFARASK